VTNVCPVKCDLPCGMQGIFHQGAYFTGDSAAK